MWLPSKLNFSFLESSFPSFTCCQNSGQVKKKSLSMKELQTEYIKDRGRRRYA